MSKSKHHHSKGKGKNEDYFIEVDKPTELRKNILFSIRNSLKCLQEFEKLRVIREKKEQLTKEFTEVRKELYVLINKLETELPSTPKMETRTKVLIKQFEREIPKQTFTSASVPVSQPAIRSTSGKKSEIELLEEELNRVESELSKLR